MQRSTRAPRPRVVALLGAVALVASALAAVAPTSVGAETLEPPPSGVVMEKVTICHADSSNKKPYVVHTPNANGDVNGHAGHEGIIWYDATPSLKEQKIEWGDIIPPFTYEEKHGSSVTIETFPGYNWTTTGEAIYRAGCVTEPPESQDYGAIAVTKTVVVPEGTPPALPSGYTIRVVADDGTSVDLEFGPAGGTQTVTGIEAGSVVVVTELGTDAFPPATVVTMVPAGADTSGVVIVADATVTVEVRNAFAAVEGGGTDGGVEPPILVGGVAAVVATPALTG